MARDMARQRLSEVLHGADPSQNRHQSREAPTVAIGLLRSFMERSKQGDSAQEFTDLFGGNSVGGNGLVR